MSVFPYQYPEDLTGISPRNKVTNEVRTFTSHDQRIFIPSGGPFFTDNLQITDFTSGRPLEPIAQYACLHLHNEGTLDSGKQVCCIIIVKDTSISKIKITYQAIGGKYGEVVTTIRQMMESIDWDKVGRISWGSQIYGKPEVFPAAAHRHPGGEFGDWKRFHLALNNIYQAMINKDAGAWKSVYEYMARSIEVAFENNILDSSQYYTKFQIDNIVNGLELEIPEMPDQLPPEISKAPGNLITAKSDGLYYGNLLNVKTVTSSYTPTTAEFTSNLLLRMDTTTTTSTVTISKVGTTVPIGSSIYIRQVNKTVVVQAASGVTILPLNSLDMLRINQTMKLIYLGTDKWDAVIHDIKTVESNSQNIKTMENGLATHLTASHPHSQYVTITEHNAKISELTRLIQNNSGGGGGELLATVTYRFTTRATVQNPIDEEGFKFGDFNPKVFPNTRIKSTLQNGEMVNFIVTLPSQYDPAKHRVEVPGHSTYSVAGKVLTIGLRYQPQVGTENPGGDKDPYPIYWTELNETVRINIVSKVGSGGGGIVVGGGQLAATVNYRIASRGRHVSGRNSSPYYPGVLEMQDVSGFAFLDHTPKLFLNTANVVSTPIDHYEDFIVTLPSQYDPAKHRVEVFGCDSFSVSGNKVTAKLRYYILKEAYLANGDMENYRYYHYLDTNVRINLITIS